MRDAFIVATLIRRQRTVRLHANERQIRRRTDDGAQTARRQPRARLLRQRQVLTLIRFLQRVDELRVQPQSRRRVRRLSQQARGQSGVQRAEAFVLHDRRRRPDRSPRRPELQSNLDDCRPTASLASPSVFPASLSRRAASRPSFSIVFSRPSSSSSSSSRVVPSPGLRRARRVADALSNG